jgi:hypothetical protein
MLSAKDLRDAFAIGYGANHNRKYEFIDFNNCLMSSLEITDLLYPYTNYFIASEDVEMARVSDATLPATQDIKSMFEYLSKHPNNNFVDIGKK